MPETRSLEFTPFRLDLGAGQLWCGEEARPLTRKAFAVLRYLVEHAGQLVTKDELIAAVWAVPYVSDMALAACIREIRRVLEDPAQTPQFVETVRRQGYRFCATVQVVEPAAEVSARAVLPSVAMPRPRLLVGRHREMAQLQQWWARAQQGARQIVWVTGEAGIGKTTLVDAFVAQVVTTATVWIGRGQCIEQYGVGEAYLPLLEALGDIGRGPARERLVTLLRQQAPSWLLQLPALVPEEIYDTLQGRGAGVMPERMLRELAEAVEVLTTEQPLVLVLEDLHWSDLSTLEWLAYVGRRRNAARLLILGTYRPFDALRRAHPLPAMVQDLQIRGHCVELPLAYWSAAEVGTYLAQRFGVRTWIEELAPILHARTNGNPLFLMVVVDDLVRQGVVQEGAGGWELVGGREAVRHGVPENLRWLLDQQIEQLPPADQRLLEAASVVGVEFAPAALAALLETAPAEVETQCAAFARRGQFLQPGGADTWPDETVTERYRFMHALYHEVLYDRLLANQRRRGHGQIGAWLEQAYGSRARDMAAELAEHFVRGRDLPRAVQYLHYAGENALQRSAYPEAITHLTQGIALLQQGQWPQAGANPETVPHPTRSAEILATLPQSPTQAEQELDMQIALGPPLSATKGLAAPEVERTYARARALCTQVGDTPKLLPILWGLCRFYRSQGALSTARELAEQLDRLTQSATDPTQRLEAYDTLGDTFFHLGDYATSRIHLEGAIALIHQTAQRALALHHGLSPGVRSLSLAAITLWCLGAPAQALQRSQEALALALALDHPYSLAAAHLWASLLHQRRRDVVALQAQTEALVTLATVQGFPDMVGYGTWLHGWAIAMQGQWQAGLAELHQGLASILATGLGLSRPACLVLLAEATGNCGQVEEALRLLGEALEALEASERGDLLTEVYRLQGEFLLQQATADVPQAEVCFHKALSVARRQQARSWELRAAMSLSHLWQRQGKQDEARQLLTPLYGWFTEGFDTADLQEAKALLEALQKNGPCR